jgi:hypothetical protein
MKKTLLILLVLGLAVAMVPGCGGSKRKKRTRRFSSDPNEAVVERMIAAMDDLTAELKGVTDADSAAQAAPKVAEIVARGEKLQIEGEAMFEEIDEETQDALEEKYADKMDAASEALYTQVMRIVDDPELLAPLEEALAPLLGHLGMSADGDDWTDDEWSDDERSDDEWTTVAADVTDSPAYEAGASMVEKMLATVDDLRSELASVQNSRSARMAASRVEVLVAEMEAMEAQFDIMSEEWDQSVENALEARYMGDISDAFDGMVMELERIIDDPDLFDPLREALAPALEEFGLDAPDLPAGNGAVTPPADTDVTGSASYEAAAAMIDEFLDVTDDLGDELAGVQDARSARLAGPRIEALVDVIETMDERFDAMEDSVDEATEDALEARYADAVDESFGTMYSELERIVSDPELYEPLAGPLQPLLDQFGFEAPSLPADNGSVSLPSDTDDPVPAGLTDAATLAKAESMVEDMITTIADINAALTTATDRASAEAVAPRVESLMADLNALSERSDAVFANMDQASQAAIETKYTAELEEVFGEFMEQMMRVSMDPEIAEPLQDAFASMN